MPALTLQQQFGTNASIASGTLSIKLADLAAVGLNSNSPTPAKIASALVLLWKQNQGSDADQDISIGLVVGTPQINIAYRGTTQQIEYQHPVSIYTPNNLGGLDPDEVI